MEKALSFAINYRNPEIDTSLENIPTLLLIQFSGKSQYFYLNSGAVSAFSKEKEVLLQDGIQYKVVDRYF